MKKDNVHVIGNHIPFKDIVNYYKIHSLLIPIQIFTGSPRSFHRSEKDIKDTEGIKDLLKKIHLYVHSSYVINLGSPTSSKSETYLKKDLKISNNLNARGLVIHVSKSLNRNPDLAVKDMYDSILHILEFCHKEDIDTKLLLETPAGQGTELLTTLEDFVAFCKLVKKTKYGSSFGITVDTCHVFSLGYEPDYYIKSVLDSGLEINLVHLNDSENKKGSKVDRHARVFTGKIDHSVLNNCIKICEKNDIDMVYEVNF